MGLVFAEPHDTQAYSDTAALLLAMAEEQGLHVRVVQTVLGGFLVPDSISDLIQGPQGEPPASWDAPLDEVTVHQDTDGRYYVAPQTELIDAVSLPEEDRPFFPDGQAEISFVNPKPAAASREDIRAWGRENGHAPAESGKLKGALVEAFRAANPDLATTE